MWKGKFLELKDDIKELTSKITRKIFKNITKEKLTPLEFTILESIFTNKAISGYDLIAILNKHFAGTWKAHSGTVYPILSKLKRDGFLKVQTVKSPIGPLRKVYTLTEAGEEILKHKVGKSFTEQLKFIENFLIDFSSIYLHSFSDAEREEQIERVQNLIRDMLGNVINRIPATVAFRNICPKCKAAVDRTDAAYCPFCGSSLFGEEPSQ